MMNGSSLFSCSRRACTSLVNRTLELSIFLDAFDKHINKQSPSFPPYFPLSLQDFFFRFFTVLFLRVSLNSSTLTQLFIDVALFAWRTEPNPAQLHVQLLSSISHIVDVRYVTATARKKKQVLRNNLRQRLSNYLLLIREPTGPVDDGQPYMLYLYFQSGQITRPPFRKRSKQEATRLRLLINVLHRGTARSAFLIIHATLDIWKQKVVGANQPCGQVAAWRCLF